jgi:hypothetical protein
MKSAKKKKKKKGTKKGPKKGYCERSGFQLPFSALFQTLFGSLYLFHTVWVLLCFLKGHIAPQMFKRTGVNFSGIYSSLGYIIC